MFNKSFDNAIKECGKLHLNDLIPNYTLDGLFSERISQTMNFIPYYSPVSILKTFHFFKSLKVHSIF